jgi:hypothetical protein
MFSSKGVTAIVRRKGPPIELSPGDGGMRGE